MKRALLVAIILTACAGAQQFEIVVNQDRFQPDTRFVEPNQWIEIHHQGTTLVFMTPRYSYTTDPQYGAFIFQVDYIAPDWIFGTDLLVLVDGEVSEFEVAFDPMREVEETFSALLRQAMIREKMTFIVPEDLITRMLGSDAVAVSIRSADSKFDIDLSTEAIEKVRIFYDYIVQLRSGT